MVRSVMYEDGLGNLKTGGIQSVRETQRLAYAKKPRRW